VGHERPSPTGGTGTQAAEGASASRSHARVAARHGSAGAPGGRTPLWTRCTQAVCWRPGVVGPPAAPGSKDAGTAGSALGSGPRPAVRRGASRSCLVLGVPLTGGVPGRRAGQTARRNVRRMPGRSQLLGNVEKAGKKFQDWRNEKDERAEKKRKRPTASRGERSAAGDLAPLHLPVTGIEIVERALLRWISSPPTIVIGLLQLRGRPLSARPRMPTQLIVPV